MIYNFVVDNIWPYLDTSFVSTVPRQESPISLRYSTGGSEKIACAHLPLLFEFDTVSRPIDFSNFDKI